MANFESIFTSDLDENSKRAKSIFGKLLISLRKNDYMKLYSLMSGVSDTKYEDNAIKLVFSDNTAYEMVNNSSDIAVLSELVANIDSTLKLQIESSGEKSFDEHKFTEYLKDEFGKLLTIK